MRYLSFICLLTILIQYSSTRPSNKLEDDFYVDVASGDHHEDEILTSKEKEVIREKYSAVIVDDRSTGELNGTNSKMVENGSQTLEGSTNEKPDTKNFTKEGAIDANNGNLSPIPSATNVTEKYVLQAPSNNETAPSNSMTNNGTESPLCKGKWVKIAETKVCAETPSLKSTLSSKTRRLG